MNEYKFMCEISFPRFDRKIDVAIPVNKTVYYVMTMLVQLINDDFSKDYKPTGQEILVDQDLGITYDKNILVKESQIKNGSKLVFY